MSLLQRELLRLCPPSLDLVPTDVAAALLLHVGGAFRASPGASSFAPPVASSPPASLSASSPAALAAVVDMPHTGGSLRAQLSRRSLGRRWPTQMASDSLTD